MTRTIEFFYDVGSTNSYFALHLLQDVAARANAEIVYQPFNLGYVFRHHNYVLMDEPKVKLRNRKRDLERWAHKYDLPFRMPDQFPIKTAVALRGALAMRQWGKEREFLFAVFARYWEHNDPSIADLASLAAIAGDLGVDPAAFAAAADGAAVRAELIEATNSALTRGVFGAPTMLVADEMFWGKDRMDFISDELAR